MSRINYIPIWSHGIFSATVSISGWPSVKTYYLVIRIFPNKNNVAKILRNQLLNLMFHTFWTYTVLMHFIIKIDVCIRSSSFKFAFLYLFLRKFTTLEMQNKLLYKCFLYFLLLYLLLTSIKNLRNIENPLRYKKSAHIKYLWQNLRKDANLILRTLLSNYIFYT